MGAFLRGLITKPEFKNFSSTRNKYRDEMENRCAYVVLVMFLFIIFFLLKCGFLWNHFVTQNVMINTKCVTKWVWTSPLTDTCNLFFISKPLRYLIEINIFHFYDSILERKADTKWLVPVNIIWFLSISRFYKRVPRNSRWQCLLFFYKPCNFSIIVHSFALNSAII